MPRRPILLALLVAAVATLGFVLVVRTSQEGEPARDGRRAGARRSSARPSTATPFDLASRRRAAGRRQLLGSVLRPLPRRVPAARGEARRARGRRPDRRRGPDRRPGRTGARLRRRVRRDLADGRRPGQGDQDGLSRRGPAADLLRRRRGRHPGDPGRRAHRRRLRAAVREDRPVSVGDPAVVVEGLVKRYGGRAVVDGVSLEVAAGELVALLGPNGAGKTTTVEIVEGYRRADGGTVRVLGVDPARGGRTLRARVGLMLQGGGIDPRARPRETLVQYGRFHADPRDADELLDLVGLRAVARTPLPAAVRRRAAATRAGAGARRATRGRWSSTNRRRGWTRRRGPRRGPSSHAEREAGAAILLTSHDLVDVERLADRIVIIDAGRVVAVGHAGRAAGGRRGTAPVPAGPGALLRGEVAALVEALAGGRPGSRGRADGDDGRYRRRGCRSRRRARRRGRRVVRRRRSAHRRAPVGRREPRGRLPRPRRRRPRVTEPPDEPPRLARCGDPRPGVDGAAADRAARRERPRHDRHPGRRPAVLRDGRASSTRVSRTRSTSSCPGALALAVIATSLVNLGIATAYERNYGVLKRLGGSPLTRGGLLAAKMGTVLVVEVAQVVLLVAIAVGVLGWSAGPGASRRGLRRRACCSAPPRSRVSACCSPGRFGPRRRSRSRTACSSRSCCSAGSSIPVVAPARAAGDRRLVAAGGGAGGRVPRRARVGRRGDLGRSLASLAAWAIVTRGARRSDVPLGVTGGPTVRPPDRHELVEQPPELALDVDVAVRAPDDPEPAVGRDPRPDPPARPVEGDGDPGDEAGRRRPRRAPAPDRSWR